MDIDALALHAAEGLRVWEKVDLWQAIRAGTPVASVDLVELSGLVGRPVQSANWNPVRLWQLAAEQAEVCVRQDWSLISLVDEDRYPVLLGSIHQPPFLLFGAGRLPQRQECLLAVVGTRYPSEDARVAAWDFGASCARSGVGLVSGLAYGIDGAAHAGVVQAQGRTVAVLPGGLDQVTPRGNRRVAAQILDCGGCLLSEAPPGTVPAPWRFVVRNRIIAGLAPATVVIEAPAKSGALLTANYALEEGRDVWVHPVGCDPRHGEGTLKLRSDGAGEVHDARELVERYGRIDPSL